MEKENADRLISEAAKSIFTYCRTRTNSREEAEDLSQELSFAVQGIILSHNAACGNNGR